MNIQRYFNVLSSLQILSGCPEFRIKITVKKRQVHTVMRILQVFVKRLTGPAQFEKKNITEPL